jgi:hypothetical protein
MYALDRHNRKGKEQKRIAQLLRVGCIKNLSLKMIAAPTENSWARKL